MDVKDQNQEESKIEISTFRNIEISKFRIKPWEL